MALDNLPAIPPIPLSKKLQLTGQFPQVELQIIPLPIPPRVPITITNFLSYDFVDSVMTPVNTFKFTFVPPNDFIGKNTTFLDWIREGDICILKANGTNLSQGIVDQIEIEVNDDVGEQVTVIGRNFLGQLEDQDAISIAALPLDASKITISAAIRTLILGTRILKTKVKNVPQGPFLFATEPGESKLAVLHRFLDPFNVIFYMDANGTLVVTKPNMSMASVEGKITCSQSQRTSNVLNIRMVRKGTQIPNLIYPIWANALSSLGRTTIEPPIKNTAATPARLLATGHIVPKTVVVSNPQANSPQGLSDVNALTATAPTNFLKAYAKREMARQNFNEMHVTATVVGHFNDLGMPFQKDTPYFVDFDRGKVNELMYLYEVQYNLTPQGGQRTNLAFCKTGTIVADVPLIGVG